MKKVLIPTKLNSVAAEALKDHGQYTVVQDENADLEVLCSEHADTYALIVRSEKVSSSIIDLLPKLKVVIRAGAGFNTIDIKYARQKGIDVMNTPGANSNAVAEEVVALMLADARHIIPGHASMLEEKWEKKKFMGKEITGKTVGIVGFGAIGKLVAKRLSGFDVTVLAYDPFLSESKAKEFGVNMVGLKALFEQSDYISLHMPENEETRGIINHDYFSVMKDGATIVNCARSGIIDEPALRAIKQERNIRFLNDVYPKDEAGPKTVADVADIMLPHLGASTVEANLNAARRAAEQLIDYDEKGIMSYVVNRDVPEGLDEHYAELAFTIARLCRRLAGPKNQMKVIETSFYGNLKKFSDWLIVPVVAALSKEFDRTMDSKVALQYLQDMGVDYINRETDDSKGYGDALTIDLIAHEDKDNLVRISVRGTVAESRLMVSRINDFEKLYFEPEGDAAIFVYKDRPGVLGQIGVALSEIGVNIDDVRNPHDSSGEKSIAIMKVSQSLSEEQLADIGKLIDAQRAVAVTF